METGALPESVLIEKHGMAKRYERYRKEYTSRQVGSHVEDASDDSFSPSTSLIAMRHGSRSGTPPVTRRVPSGDVSTAKAASRLSCSTSMS